MSNLEDKPPELDCRTATATGVEILTPRDVPLGGPRAMRVRRTLPQRERSLIGAWCFVDHYGPDEVADSGGMVVPPHPHTGLQTVSWLFTGEVEHRDSAGHHAMVRPGEVNLMTAGRGISHSEVSPPTTTTLHGAQLWVALPDAGRFVDPGFAHHAPVPVTGPGFEARVFLGSLLGDTSPVSTYTPLLGAEILLSPGTSLVLDVDPTFEHGVLVDAGVVVGRRCRDQAERPRLRPARLRRRSSSRRTTSRCGCCSSAARRSARHRDVVEHRRPHPRGGRRVADRVAGPDHPTARSSGTPRTSPTVGSASCPATTCRPSPRRRSPTPA